MEDELNELIKQQEIDRKTWYIRHQIIKPTLHTKWGKVFEAIADNDKRAIWLLFHAHFPREFIAKRWGISRWTVTRIANTKL